MTDQESTVPNMSDVPENITIDDIQDVNLLAVQLDTPKRRARGYDAEQVDRVIREAQRHLDMQYAFIQNNLNNAQGAGDTERVEYLEAQLAEVMSSYEVIKGQADELHFTIGQLKTANADLREELRSALNNSTRTHESTVAVSIDEEKENTAHDTPSGILLAAERLAQEHINEAKAQAEATIREAKDSAEEIIGEAYREANLMGNIVEKTLTAEEALQRISEITSRVSSDTANIHNSQSPPATHSSNN